MALHPSRCRCEACQESSEESTQFGYPAFSTDPNFPSPEGWWQPGNAPERWQTHALGAVPSQSLSMPSDSDWTPANFGRRKGLRGPAFVPGTVPPAMPSNAFQTVQAGLISPVDGMPNQALLTQAANSSDGIAPTQVMNTIESAALAAGMNLNADGTLSVPAFQLTPTEMIMGALALLLIL